MTPVGIDTALGAIWEKYYTLADTIAMREGTMTSTEAHVERMLASKSAYYRDVEAPRLIAHIEETRASIRLMRGEQDALMTQAAPYEEEYDRRGRWSRYFRVLNGNGHVHRGRNCSTCYPTTRYGWLTTLSDCDEATMVAEYGHVACTVCFPDAPVEELRRAYDAARYCSNSGAYVELNGNGWSGHTYKECSVCHKTIAVSRRTGKMRKHAVA